MGSVDKCVHVTSCPCSKPQVAAFWGCAQLLSGPLFPDSGEQVLVDMETKTNKEIVEHIRRILGKDE